MALTEYQTTESGATEYVDENGEIVEIPAGEDLLYYAAQRAQNAQDQVKAWERELGAWKSLLLRDQEDRRAVYGDVAASLRQSSRAQFQPEPFAEYLEDAMLPELDVRELVKAARAFDVKTLPAPLAAIVEQFIDHVPTRRFVVVERVRKLAPERRLRVVP